jgi:hypothetical protein
VFPARSLEGIARDLDLPHTALGACASRVDDHPSIRCPWSCLDQIWHGCQGTLARLHRSCTTNAPRERWRPYALEGLADVSILYIPLARSTDEAFGGRILMEKSWLAGKCGAASCVRFSQMRSARPAPRGGWTTSGWRPGGESVLPDCRYTVNILLKIEIYVRERQAAAVVVAKKSPGVRSRDISLPALTWFDP